MFFETAESLVASDTDTVNDVYERFGGTTTHISIGPAGGNAAIAAFFAGISDAGLRIFFDTRESLMASDTDTARDVYVADVAGYARPKGATPLRVSLVPAYQQCTAPNRTHGPPLASGSCNPPAAESSQPDGRHARRPTGSRRTRSASRGTRRSSARRAARTTPTSSFTFSFTDVRRQGTLADYTGQLQATTTVRITDRLNGPSQAEAGAPSATSTCR